MKKIVWVGRHPLTDEQADSLAGLLGVDCLHTEHLNPTWFATSDADSDTRRNSESWLFLVDRASTGEVGEQPVIAGEFPPVALEALPETDFSWYTSPKILTPAGVGNNRWVQLAAMAN